MLELKFLLRQLADRRVKEIYDQPERVYYVDETGQLRHHTFDFLVELLDGTRIAYAIKPERKADAMRRLLKLMRPQIPQHFADFAVVRTEADIQPTLVSLASAIIRYRATRCERAISCIVDIMSRTIGAVEIGRIVATAGLGAAAFGAIVNLIDDGVLNLSDTKLNYHSLVSRNQNITIASA